MCCETSNDIFWDLDFFKNVTSTLIGAFIGTATTVLIYFMTIRSEKKKERKNREETRRNKLFYTKTLLESFDRKIDDTIESLEGQISSFEEDIIPFHLPVFSINESSTLLNDLLKSEETFELHNKYFGTDKIKHYNNLRNELAFYEIQLAQIEDMNSRAKDYDFQRKKDVSEKVDQIMEDLIKIYDMDGISDKDKDEFFSFSVDFGNRLKDKSDVRFYFEEYLIPLMEMLLKHSKIKQIGGLISQVKRAMIIYQHIEGNNLAHLNNLKSILLKINNLKGQLKKDSKHIISEEFVNT
ncbi:MAG: hypothetical protein Crog4KO_01690 [Crocinitomicaceae bacterium]